MFNVQGRGAGVLRISALITLHHSDAATHFQLSCVAVGFLLHLML